MSNNSYKQYLKLDGKRTVVAVPEFFRETGLRFNINGNVTSVLIPLDESTKSALSAIETFVQANVKSDKYKPLWLKDFMFCNISHWCNYVQVNHDGTHTSLKQDSILGKGTYSMLIHASHVYVGSHKNGETYSLSLHVTEIRFKPYTNIMELIESLDYNCAGESGVVQPTSQAPPFPTSQPTSLFHQTQPEVQVLKATPQKKRGGRGSKKGPYETDGQRNISKDLAAKTGVFQLSTL